MTQIYLENGVLDLYKQDIEWQWETVRFSDALKDQYTTDITIPKNNHNLSILGACALLDRTDQPLGGKNVPCTLSTGQKQIDAYLEVVSLTDDDINICVYERTIDNTNIKKWLFDNQSTIFHWNVDTRTLYPNDFKTYWYGMGYNVNAAQVHPCKRLNDIIDKVSLASGVDIPHCDNKHYAVATKKLLCPQNKRQVIEGHWTKDSDEYAAMSGGQHITNDLEWSWSADATEITFNRHCRAKMKIWYAWEKEGYVTNQFFFNVVRHTQGVPDYAITCFMNSDQWANRVEYMSDDHFLFEEGSTLKVRCPAYILNRYKTLNFVMILDFEDYDITEWDYDTEMQYVGRLPRLLVPSNDKKYAFGINQAFQEYEDYQYLVFDGGVIGYHYNRTGHSAERLPHYVQGERCSFCYFGYYTNLPDIEVKDLLFGLCWLDRKKVVKRAVTDNYALYNKVDLVNCEESVVLEGIITETRVSDDRLGKSNYIIQTGEPTNHPVTTIDNEWLEDKVTLHQSPFSYTPAKFGPNWGCIEQYSNMEYDEENDSYDCDFEDVEGFCIMDSGVVSTMLYHPYLSTMGFESVKQSIGVTIETYEPIMDYYDYVYLDGRKYFVCSGTTDLNTNLSTLECILTPFNEEVLNQPTNNGGSGQNDDPHEPYDPSNPDDPDQPEYPDHPEYPEDY